MRSNSIAAPMAGNFGRLLPGNITAVSVRSGNEWIIPLLHLTEAIKIADEQLIAVLGVEVFHLSPHGHRTEGYTAYEFKLQGDWRAFVSQNNQAAAQYIADHQFGDGYGYTLTTTSAEEFNHLRDQIK